ncbi:pyridoxal-dependent decarboxylase, exosortase A system-associated [Sphingomonas sp.]|uniref:pyridoxal-dependent decarboxylase, exosortase A system-associated n=1 Tax=Sphingomonas sp. TaxID=28214 RepID=UPI001E1888C6|nr:pyridoxal-dependent decarboxylase, exosortase A system-associated [Sphingomonas sp.]MBX9796329.1 pyridoxal-dependent decarboxylase, exosortase A system-associated [Sphingomonas sp.]
MKPMGSIPADFRGGETLTIAGRSAEDWIGIAGCTPLFVYDMAVVARRISKLRAAMPPALAVHYAVKANPFRPLVEQIAPLVDGLDVASAGELALAQAVAPASPVSFAGPGKRDAELAAAITAGATINLESAGEAARALAAAEQLGIAPKLAIRVNPDFELRGSGMRMGGRASPFGVDAEQVPALVRQLQDAGADWRGFHIFAGSQALDAEAIIETQAQTVALAARLADAVGAAPPLVNLGGGFGIPYFPGEQPLDIGAIGAVLAEVLDRRAPSLASTRFALELGRWLVGEAGVYLTRIVDRKQSKGETFLVTDGGLHHQLAASGNFGTVVRRNYPLALANRLNAAADEVVNVVGCLCTPLDRLGDQVSLPRAEIGDVIAIFMAGAYGLSASPTAFLGHPAPVQILAGIPSNPNAIFTC